MNLGRTVDTGLTLHMKPSHAQVKQKLSRQGCLIVAASECYCPDARKKMRLQHLRKAVQSFPSDFAAKVCLVPLAAS